MRKLFLILLFMVLVAGLIFGSCTKVEPTTTGPTTPEPTTSPTPTATLTPKYGGVLRILGGSIPVNIGWPADVLVPMSNVQCCLDTLLRGDNQGNIVPWLAESYKLADDLKSVTLSLRKGVKFHDGSDFNAEVAKWNLENYINAHMQTYWASVEIIDDYTIRVNFTQWQNTVLASLVEPVFPPFMISKVAFDKNGMEWVRSNPIGTGPYKFDSFIPDVSFKVVKNPDYWVKGKPYLDGIEYICIADEITRKMSMKAGEGDMADATPKDAAEYIALGFNARVIPNMKLSLIPDTANTDSPWANKQVREAVEYAIDREAIAKAFGYNFMEAPYQIIPRSCTSYNPDFALGRRYDPEKSKQLLAEAGYPNGFKTTFIIFPAANRDIVVAMQADLAKVGIQVDLDFPEMASWVTYMGPMASWNNAAIVMAISAVDVHWAQGLQFLFNMTGQSWQRTPELMQAYQTAVESPTIDIKLIRAVSDMITKDAMMIPIYEGGAGRAAAPYVNAGFGERSSALLENMENIWLNK